MALSNWHNEVMGCVQILFFIWGIFGHSKLPLAFGASTDWLINSVSPFWHSSFNCLTLWVSFSGLYWLYPLSSCSYLFFNLTPWLLLSVTSTMKIRACVGMDPDAGPCLDPSHSEHLPLAWVTTKGENWLKQ